MTAPYVVSVTADGDEVRTLLIYAEDAAEARVAAEEHSHDILSYKVESAPDADPDDLDFDSVLNDPREDGP